MFNQRLETMYEEVVDAIGACTSQEKAGVDHTVKLAVAVRDLADLGARIIIQDEHLRMEQERLNMTCAGTDAKPPK